MASRQKNRALAEVGGAVESPDAQVIEKVQNPAYDEQMQEQNIKDRQQLREQRKEYADKLFSLITVWLIGVFVLLASSGGGIEVCGRVIGVRFSDTVMVTYLTTTTVTVMGLFVIVAKWLFPPLLGGEGDDAEG